MTYSLHSDLLSSTYTILVYNPTDTCWAFHLPDLADWTLKRVLEGWPRTCNSERVGPAICTFNSLVDLHQRYPELFL